MDTANQRNLRSRTKILNNKETDTGTKTSLRASTSISTIPKKVSHSNTTPTTSTIPKKVSNSNSTPTINANCSRKPNSTSVTSQRTITNRTSNSFRLSSSRITPSNHSTHQRFTEVETILSEIEDWCKKLKEDNESLQNVISELTGLEVKNLDIEARQDLLKSENENLQRTVSDLRSEVKSLRSLIKKTVEDKELIVELNTEHQRNTADLKLELSGLSDQLQSFKEAQLLLDKGISLEQQKLNCNIIIRGVEVTEDTGEEELQGIYNKLRENLGFANIDDFAAVSVKVLKPYNITKANHSVLRQYPIQVVLSSVNVKRQFLQIRRVKKDITPTNAGIVQKSKNPILISEELTRDNQYLLFATRSLRETHKYKFV